MENVLPEMNDTPFVNYPQQPHGGKLVNRVLEGNEHDEAMEKAKQLPAIMVDMEAVITLE